VLHQNDVVQRAMVQRQHVKERRYASHSTRGEVRLRGALALVLPQQNMQRAKKGVKAQTSDAPSGVSRSNISSGTALANPASSERRLRWRCGSRRSTTQPRPDHRATSRDLDCDAQLTTSFIACCVSRVSR
jgi:hypothetical protein